MKMGKLYIGEEIGDDEIPAQTLYRKVGITDQIEEKDGRDCHGRFRAFGHGNCRDVVCVKSYLMKIGEARYIESKVHAILKENYGSRYEITNRSGHSEWFRATRQQIEEIIEKQIANYHKYGFWDLDIDLYDSDDVIAEVDIEENKTEIIYEDFDNLFKED